MRAEVDRGDKQSIFRNKQQIMMAKNDKKDWIITLYLKGEVLGTISRPITPGSVLKKNLNSAINPSRAVNDKLLVIEDGGMPIHYGLRV